MQAIERGAVITYSARQYPIPFKVTIIIDDNLLWIGCTADLAGIVFSIGANKNCCSTDSWNCVVTITGT